MKLGAGLLALALCLGCQGLRADPSPMTLQEELKALIGLQYVSPRRDERIADHLSCTYQGGSVIGVEGVAQDDWSYGELKCQGRYVLTLKRTVGRAEPNAIFRIVDAVLLPPATTYAEPERPDSLYRLTNGDCELKGRVNTDFIVLLRWSKRARVDWRTGVKHAWTFDLKKERIAPLSTRHIVCHLSEHE